MESSGEWWLSLPDGRLLVTAHLHPTSPNQPTENTRVELLDGQRRETVLGAGFEPVAYVNGRYLLAQRFGVNRGLWAFEYSATAGLRPGDGQLVAANAENVTVAQEGTILIRFPPADRQCASWFGLIAVVA